MPKLIVYLETGLGGQRAWLNSDVRFDDIVLELSYSSTLGVEPEADSILEGPYSFDQWTMPTEKVEERIAGARAKEKDRQRQRAWRDGEVDTEEVPCDHPCDTCVAAHDRPIRDSEDRVWTMGPEGEAVQMCEQCGHILREDDEGDLVCPRCGTDFGDGVYRGEGKENDA